MTSTTDSDLAPETVTRAPDLFAPLRGSVAWLAGTYLLFLVVGEVGKVDDLFGLSAYIAFTITCLIVGYWLKANTYRGKTAPSPVAETPRRISQIKILTTLSALYYAAYGLTYMSAFGVASPTAVINALRNPGSAYLAKFDVFASQTASGANNAGAQILTLTAVLSAPLVPFVVIYWRHLTADVRLVAFLGMGLYLSLFLAIGTLVGLGNMLIFAGIGYMVTKTRAARIGKGRRWVTALAVAGVVAFTSYMAYNQAARLEAVGISYRYEPNPIVKSIASDQFARGVTVVAFYPTHGYQGLAYNREQPFEWTHGRGASRGLDSYLTQYGFGQTVSGKTYPKRTQNATGWDSGVYWSTIYPWLASDLTFFGAALFMGVIGWWMARLWWEAAVVGSRLSLLLLCQIGVLIAYVPANNQLGIGRPTIICLTTLLVLYGWRAMSARLTRGSQGCGHAL